MKCFQNFQSAADQKKIVVNATTLRAMFMACIDCSPLFSGMGLGYNNVASPLVVSGKTAGADSYPGREFTVKNLPLKGLNQVTKDLPAIPAKMDLSFLDNGFWSGVTP